jgi:tRNA pseudouridine55 synthase
MLDLVERDVVVHALEITGVNDRQIDLTVRCSKGFYVRALARDLALALGTVGHLCALRRTRSGAFCVDETIESSTLESAVREDCVRQTLSQRLLPLSQSCVGLPKFILTEQGCRDARNGRLVAVSSIITGDLAAAPTGPIALLNAGDQLVAIAQFIGESLKVVRGFRTNGV